MNVLRVNGVIIETDKPGIAVVNNYVTFGDGSKYNIQTGEFVDMGHGYVRVNGELLHGNPSSGGLAQADTTVTRSVNFTDIDVLSVDASSTNVTIGAHDEPVVHIELIGDRDLVDGVEINKYGHQLMLVERTASNNVMTIDEPTDWANLSVSGLGNQPLRIDILVPAAMPISASASTSSRITINHVNGPLSLHAKTSGRIHARRVPGHVDISTATSGKVTIDEARIESLMVGAATSSKVVVNGYVQNAVLSASTSAKITIEHIESTPFKMENTSGRIRVSRIG